MAPKRNGGDVDLALRQQLAEMKRVPLEQVGHIRMTPDKLPSLVDVTGILCDKNSNDSAEVVRTIVNRHDLKDKLLQVKFGGRGGHRESLVPKDLAALIEIIFLLPGRAAAQVRRVAAQIFVRYLGGDLTLIQEVEHLRHVQNFLRETAPEHPMRAFGEAVENSKIHELKRKREEAKIAEVNAARPLSLPEACLDWLKDLKVSRQDLSGVKTQFKAICQVEILAGKLPHRSPVELWAKAPPLRLKELAQGAVESFVFLLERRYETIVIGSIPAVDDGNPGPQNSDKSNSEDDDVLKISDIMREAGVWKAVWATFGSDLANQMLSLKCAETDGSFAERRTETVQGHIHVLVHKYKKNTDWPLAWRALQNTRDVYEKRVREFLEDMFRLADQPEQMIGQSSTNLARDIAAKLRVAA